MFISFEDFTKIWSEKFYNDQTPQEHFLTLPQISDIFALAILSHIKSLGINDKITLIELGAGDGDLAEKIIDYSHHFQLNFDKLILIEKIQKRIENILKKLERYKGIVSVSKEIDNIDLHGSKKNFTVVIANEFFDSLPFSVVKIQQQRIYELFVSLNNNDIVKLCFKEPREKVLNFILRYIGDEISSTADEFFFEVSPSFDAIKNFRWADYLIISDYGYRYFSERSPFGSVSIHWRFWVEKLDFSDITSAEAKISKFFGKGDISFFVDFEILEKILKEESFHTEIKRLSSFTLLNLQNFKEISENFLKSRKENILSFSDIMSGWGNFFVLTASRDCRPGY